MARNRVKFRCSSPRNSNSSWNLVTAKALGLNLAESFLVSRGQSDRMKRDMSVHVEVFGRRLPRRGEAPVIPASENLDTTRHRLPLVSGAFGVFLLALTADKHSRRSFSAAAHESGRAGRARQLHSRRRPRSHRRRERLDCRLRRSAKSR
jgi:hypothetical protein